MVLDTFDRVPRILEVLSENLKIRQTDPKIKTRATDLVNTLVDTIAELIGLLLNDGFSMSLGLPTVSTI